MSHVCSGDLTLNCNAHHSSNRYPLCYISAMECSGGRGLKRLQLHTFIKGAYYTGMILAHLIRMTKLSPPHLDVLRSSGKSPGILMSHYIKMSDQILVLPAV